jgi:hypothetical protein
MRQVVYSISVWTCLHTYLRTYMHISYERTVQLRIGTATTRNSLALAVLSLPPIIQGLEEEFQTKKHADENASLST